MSEIALETLGMASALAALENASATFIVAGVGTVTDPETGNVKPVDDAVTVPLYLKGDRQRAFEFPGVEVIQSTFDGYALSALDTRIAIGTKGTLAFGGDAEVKCEVVGLRMPFGKTGLLGETLASVMGERIQLVARD